jgi:hypothetical protein
MPTSTPIREGEPGYRRDRDPARAHAHTFIAPPEKRYDPWTDVPPCPDGAIGPGDQWEVRAQLWHGQFKEGRLVRQTTLPYPDRKSIEQRTARLRESMPALAANGFGQARLVRLREGVDGFAYGWDTAPGWWGGSQLTTPYIPLLPGPATRQLYWADYFAMSAKAFEAWNHDPIAHRAVEIGTDFILGRGVEAHAKTDLGQQTWDAFAKLNKLEERMEDILGDLAVYGEIMLRYFITPGTLGGRQLVVRSLDPAGIYEIVTDQEDIESVYFYHQQEQERAQLFAPPAGNLAPTGPTTPQAVTRYTIRQIPAQEIDHYKINSRSGEIRGRSDLFPALGYLLRLRDLMTATVVRADMEARMVFDLMVKGSQGDIDAVAAKLFPGGRPPPPGSYLGHNDNVDLNAFEFTSTSGSGSGVSDVVNDMVNLIALGVGVSKTYLWQGGGGSSGGGQARANALVATEPGQKRFERRQRLAQRILQDMHARNCVVQGVSGEDAQIEFIFPPIAAEDDSTMLNDLAFGESNQWWSKQTAATVAARAKGMDTYDFADEQQLIAEEFDNAQDDEETDETNPVTGEKTTKPAQGGGVIRRPMMNATYRQAPKPDPTKAGSDSEEDEPPGLLTPLAGAAAATAAAYNGGPTPPGATGGQTTRGGFPADENPASGAGAANIRKDNMRESEAVQVLREAGRLVARIPRRRPDDPEYLDASKRYRDEAQQIAAELVTSLHPAAASNGHSSE